MLLDRELTAGEIKKLKAAEDQTARWSEIPRRLSVAAKHYARWTGGNTYRSPLNVGDGEVLADLLARFQIPSPQESPHRQSS